MSLPTYFRGRLSYMDTLELEMPHFSTLRYMMYKESKTEEGKQRKEAEIIEDGMMEGMT